MQVDPSTLPFQPVNAVKLGFSDVGYTAGMILQAVVRVFHS
jgi:hypothetical protein